MPTSHKMSRDTDDICGVIVLDKNNRLLVVKGIGGIWSLPKGHRKENENIYEAALREAREETGIDLTDQFPVAFIKLARGSYYLYKLKASYAEIPQEALITPEEVLDVAWLKRKQLFKEHTNHDLGFYIHGNHNFRNPQHA